MGNLEKISSKKFLARALKRNIDAGTNKCFEYNGFKLYRDGVDGYKILDEDMLDIGTFKIDEINEYFISSRLSKKSKQTQKPIKSKPRKKKRFDIISNEFMAFVKGFPCMVEGCSNKNIEAHHIYGRQPARHDILTVPLCKEHHTGSKFSVHEGNVREFREQYTRPKMEKVALEILKEWNKTSMSNEMSQEIEKHLSRTSKPFTAAIKEFILGRRKANKESIMGKG